MRAANFSRFDDFMNTVKTDREESEEEERGGVERGREEEEEKG